MLHGAPAQWVTRVDLENLCVPCRQRPKIVFFPLVVSQGAPKITETNKTVAQKFGNSWLTFFSATVSFEFLLFSHAFFFLILFLLNAPGTGLFPIHISHLPLILFPSLRTPTPFVFFNIITHLLHIFLAQLITLCVSLLCP